MPRFLAVVLAALACAFVYLVATGIALPAAASIRAMFIVSAVALLVSTAAIVLALIATVRTRAQRIAVQNLARSIDAAFTDFKAERKSGGRALATHAEAAETPPLPAEDGFVSHADDADRRPIEIAGALPHRTTSNGMSYQAASVERTDPGTTSAPPASRLRPLISVVTGAIAGFDALADDADEGVASGGLRRPVPKGAGQAALERALVLGAIDDSSQPGVAGERTPVHVSISQALLADREQLALVIEALRRLNGSARSIVLTLPTGLMEQPAQYSTALARLAATRSRFGAEGWPSSAAGVEAVWRSGVSFLRLPAAELLARDGHDGGLGTASLIGMLATRGMTAVATGVHAQADRVELGRLGVGLMTDTTMAGPLHPQPGNGTGKARHIQGHDLG